MSNNAFPYIQPDFYSESELVIGEIFSHIGKPKKGQDNKIANDILKMLLLDKFTGKIHRKIIVVCDEAEKKKLQGLSALAEGMLALLGNISAKRLCQFDERSRGSSEGYLHSSVKIDWCSERLHRKDMHYLTDAQYTAVLCAGTFHGNGYCRQICVEELKDWENSLPYLMLRLNDWALPVLDKVKNSGRRENQQVLKVEQEISCQMHRKFADCKLWDIPEYEISVKNAIYRFVYQNDVLNLSKLERLLLLEKSKFETKK